MVSKKSRTEVREKKHSRMRNHLAGTAERPRLAVFRSNNHMYAQIIDDTVGNTLVSASTLEKDVKAEVEKTNNVDAMSFAFVPDLEDWSENEDGTYERTIRSIALLEECSILSCTPAYSATEVNTRSLENFKEQKKQEQEIRKQTILSKMDAKLQEIEEATKNII